MEEKVSSELGLRWTGEAWSMMLALTMAVHVAAEGLRLAELEGTEPALVHLTGLVLPSQALLLYP
jgi:hypothetical protein